MVFASANLHVELAKSGRSICHSCGEYIRKGAPRFGISMGGYRYEWYCKDCGKQMLDTAQHELQVAYIKYLREHLKDVK